MVRTYNSQATYKTPLGHDWDFAFNIVLFKEYDPQNPATETAAILKAGDGTLYRFPKTESGIPGHWERIWILYMEMADIKST